MKKIISFTALAFLVACASAPLAQADTSMTASDSMMHDTSMTTSSSMSMSDDNLSYGSMGDKVVTLQTWLVKKGLLTIPVGVSMGYFGLRTQAALISYQTSVGLPAHGYFGALTRAKISGEMSVIHDTGSMMSSSSMSH